jgi:hypothetical protein
VKVIRTRVPVVSERCSRKGPYFPVGGLGWHRLTELSQAQPAGLRVAAQATGKFLQFVPFAAHLRVLASEGGSPGGLTGDGSATGAVQHQIGGARGAPRVDHKVTGMMNKPIKVTTVIIDKALHAAHHPRCGNALSCRQRNGEFLGDSGWTA